eukprot:m.254834 g.254834  ORF g.254834 m.254834 type:complete len:479 (-) comp16178_c1_seq20:109-1545(-)
MMADEIEKLRGQTPRAWEHYQEPIAELDNKKSEYQPYTPTTTKQDTVSPGGSSDTNTSPPNTNSASQQDVPPPYTEPTADQGEAEPTQQQPSEPQQESDKPPPTKQDSVTSTDAQKKEPEKQNSSTSEADDLERNNDAEITPSVQGYAKEAFILLNQERYSEHNNSIVLCSASSLGVLVASVDADGCLKVWSVSPVITTKLSKSFSSYPTAIAWEHDSDNVLFVGIQGKIIRLNIDNSSTIEYSTPEKYPCVSALACKNTHVACALSASTKSKEGKLLFLNSKSLVVQAPLATQPTVSRVLCFHFNHNGTLLVAGFTGGMVRIIDIRSRNVIMGWQAHSEDVTGVRFSNDETTVFSSCLDGTLMRWNAHNLGKPIKQTPIPRKGAHYSTSVPDLLGFVLDAENEFVMRAGQQSSGDPGGDACVYQIRHKDSDPHTPPALRLTGHSQPVTCFDWCVHSNVCFTGSADADICIHTLFKVT